MLSMTLMIRIPQCELWMTKILIKLCFTQPSDDVKKYFPLDLFACAATTKIYSCQSFPFDFPHKVSHLRNFANWSFVTL